MKAVIKHDIPGRMRVHFNRKRLSYREADTLQYYLQGFKCIEKAVVYERTADAVIRYAGDRGEIIRIIRGYAPDEADVPAGYFESSPRELNAEYYDHIVASVALYCGKTFLLPSPVRTILTCIKAARYMWRGVKTISGKKLKVELLDAHRVYIEGPTNWRSAELVAPQALRPAVVVLLGMLAAPGKSILRNVYPINRGYQDFAARLRHLGADIQPLTGI